MARFTVDPNRVNFVVSQTGKEYQLRLLQRASAVFTTILNLLPSNYISSVQGPNYTLELKAVSVEIARLELAMEDVDLDRGFATTRSDFLYSIVGYLIAVNGQIPTTTFDDLSFKQFLLSCIKIYFQGSIPTSIRDATGLFISEDVTVNENFLLLRGGASGLDISDEYGFQIDVSGSFPPDIFNLDSSIRKLLDIVRPAHTLFRIRYLFTDVFVPNGDSINRVLDSYRWMMSNYYYDEFRRYWTGIRDRDRLGAKVNRMVVNESHTGDF